MIYVDTSVAVARLLAEDRRAAVDLWEEALVSSRLLEYELWTRLHARGLGASHGDALRLLTARLAFVETVPEVLDRALHPFPHAVRTLDALHLATAGWLMEEGEDVVLATYDARMAEAARAMGLPTAEV